jgi:maltose-binding protein MalE
MIVHRTTINAIMLGIMVTLMIFPYNVVKGADPITINFWYTENDAEKPGVLSLVAEFELTHPGVDIIPFQESFYSARSDYMQKYIAKQEPDVMRATRDWIPEFAAAKLIHPLTNTFNSTELDDYLEMAIEMVTLPDSNGVPQFYAYPQVVDTPAIMYNKQIFQIAGINTANLGFNTSWTWEEYWGILTKVNGTEYTYAEQTNHVYATTLAGLMFGAQPYYFGNGAQMFANDSVYIENAIINSTQSRYGLWFLKNLTDSTVTPNWLDQGWSTLNPNFRAGKIAMINQGPWELKQNIETEAIFEGGDNLGIVQLPHDAEGHQGVPVGCHGYIVSSHVSLASAKFNAVIEFCRYMSSVKAMKEGSIGYYHVPARRSVMELPEVKAAESYPYVKGYWDACLAGFRVPVSKDWAQIETNFGDRINEYLAGTITLDVCIARTMVLWKEYLPSINEAESTIIPPAKIDAFPSYIFIICFLEGIGMIFVKRWK